MDPIVKIARVLSEGFSLALQPPRPSLPAPQSRSQRKQINGHNSDKDNGTGMGAAHVAAPLQGRQAWQGMPALSSLQVQSVLPSSMRMHGQTAQPEAAAATATGSIDAPAAHQARLQATKDARAGSDAFAEARRQGFQAGLDAASKQARQEREAANKQVRQEREAAHAEIHAVVRSLSSLHDALLQEMQDSAAESVFTAVAKILGRAAVAQSLALAVTTEAIAQVTNRQHGRGRLVVRVGERDHDILRDALAAPDAPVLPNAVELLADPQLLPGGCLVESGTGTLDARLQTQLQQLMQILLHDRSTHAHAQA